MGCKEIIHLVIGNPEGFSHSSEISQQHMLRQKPAQCMFKSRFFEQRTVESLVLVTYLSAGEISLNWNRGYVSNFPECNFIRQWFITPAPVFHWLTWTSLHIPSSSQHVYMSVRLGYVCQFKMFESKHSYITTISVCLIRWLSVTLTTADTVLSIVDTSWLDGVPSHIKRIKIIQIWNTSSFNYEPALPWRDDPLRLKPTIMGLAHQAYMGTSDYPDAEVFCWVQAFSPEARGPQAGGAETWWPDWYACGPGKCALQAQGTGALRIWELREVNQNWKASGGSLLSALDISDGERISIFY